VQTRLLVDTRAAFRRVLGALAVMSVAAPVSARAQTLQSSSTNSTEYDGAAALGLSLRRVGTVQRVLMIGAHPDDENTQLLSTLALGRGADVAYLSLTRGEGGQNAIGSDQQEALGLIRTEELLAARRLDGARQFFARAYDYGFSKTADEAFRHWPHDSLLADVVGIIRRYRPDVIVSVFSGTPSDGHGQHQAAGIVAREAFAAAGDAARFPGQIAAGLRVWTPHRLYQSVRGTPDAESVVLSSGHLDPLIGRSYAQVASSSRSRHRSQDQGSIPQPGPRTVGVRLLAQHGASAAGSAGAGMFAGLDTLLVERARRAGASERVIGALATYDSVTRHIAANIDLRAPGGTVPLLARAVTLLQSADNLLEGSSSDLRHEIDAETLDVSDALARAAGVVFDAVADQERVVPGQTFNVDITIWNGGAQAIEVRNAVPLVPKGWQVASDSSRSTAIAAGTLLTRRFRVTVGEDAQITRAYFLTAQRKGAMYAWPTDLRLAGEPFESPPVSAAAQVVISGPVIALEREVVARSLHASLGEVRRPMRVVPAALVALDPAVAVLSTRVATPIRLNVRVTAEASTGVSGTLRIQAPEGWTAHPQDVPLTLTAGESRAVEVTVTRAGSLLPGTYSIAAVFTSAGGVRYAQTYQLVDYPHIRPRPLYREATTRIELADLALPLAQRVGYIMGAGDELPAALRQLGVQVDLLGSEALNSGDLSRYHAILVGVRAYEMRPDLRAQNRRLLDYARAGGTLIVQYGQSEFATAKYSPYPLTFARSADRVTDENATVRFLEPAARVLTAPNRLDERDFEGWVQERGLWFPQTWDPQYSAVLEMADAGEAAQRGALLVAPYGKGNYVYTGLSLFRQLPAGVPGAYRLLSNLLSLGARPGL
jgi:LmbE family N-acetylglucosaminyl deacetylase